MAHGGKRIGAGSKPGQRKTLKDGSLVVHAPKMLMLAQKYLNSENEETQKWAFKELLPYVFSKQREQQEHFFPEGVKVNIVYGNDTV